MEIVHNFSLILESKQLNAEAPQPFFSVCVLRNKANAKNISMAGTEMKEECLLQAVIKTKVCNVMKVH